MKEIIQNQEKEIAVIRLKGSPYQRTVEGIKMDGSEVLENLALNANYETHLNEAIKKNELFLQPLFDGGYYGIDKKIKKGEPLSYAESFSLMSFVSMGVNRMVHDKLAPKIKVGMTDPDTVFLQSISLLSSMSAKEAYIGLTPEEIAGFTASTLEIDTVVRIPTTDKVIGVGGMGGDKGYAKGAVASKLFSLSTLGSIVLSNFGYVHKHHSYPNTSKVAGQSAIEEFGARSDQSNPSDLKNIQEKTGLLMSSCHTTRFIHTMSHRLKGETINHIIGPLAFPVDKNTEINAFIGSNDNVHPETIIKALLVMQQNGVQKYSNSVAFCGLNGDNLPKSLFDSDLYYQDKKAKSLIAIDEVAPPPYKTLAAFLVDGRNVGVYLIEPTDFMNENMLAKITLNDLLIPNTFDSIMAANLGAITGKDIPKSIYLAMTAALGLFVKEYASLPDAFDQDSRRINRQYLRNAFERSIETINSQKAYEKLKEYVEATKSSSIKQNNRCSLENLQPTEDTN